MTESQSRELTRRPAQPIRRWFAILSLVTAMLVAVASPTVADEYDSSNSGHPVRIIAYILHPIGVLIDYIVVRPAHWFVSQEPMKTIFGHED